jgi:hypothetical protein
MGILKPNLGALPESQRLLWQRLGPTPKDFVLYGGTALALRLGHRESVDFDFFSSRSFQPLIFAQSVVYLRDQMVTQQDVNTLTCEVGTEKEAVKVSFFGGLSLRQIDMPDRAESNEIAVASLRDIFGMKCATVPQRSELKDYLDIHALVSKGNISLSEGIASASAIYGNSYSPVLTLQALSYFDDLSDPLPAAIRADLTTAVRSVSLQALPLITASRKIGASSENG